MVYLKLFRMKHYIKNILIFFPLIFSLNLFDLLLFLWTMLGFISFSLLTSSVYVMNDLKDKEEDRKHPTKKHRPIACGKVSAGQAVAWAIGLFVMAVVSTVALAVFRDNFFLLLFFLLYLINNLLYGYRLKQLPIFDVLSIAVGFLFRVMYGAAMIGVEVSPFLYLTVLFLAFYLGYGKRKGEYINQHQRQVLGKYQLSFLEKSMTSCLSLILVFYVMWALELGDNYTILKVTVPLVMFILMRYNLIIEGDSDGDPVEVIFKDKLLLWSGVSYVSVLLFLLYH